MTALLQSRHVSVMSRDGTPILTDLSFSVAAGSIYSLIGPNGAGKTTTLKALVGLISPTSGSVIIGEEGQSCIGLSLGISYLPDKCMLYNELTAMENLKYFLAMRGLIRTSERALATALRDVCLADTLVHRRANHLSKGSQQKVLLATALASNAKIIVLDEPFSGVDFLSARDISRSLMSLRDNGASILVVTHDLELARGFSDSIGILNDGRLIEERHRDQDGVDFCEDIHAWYWRSLQAA